MRRLSRPTHAATDTFLECIGRARPLTLRGRLTAAEPVITASDVDYQLRVANGTLHQMPSGDSQFNGIVTSDELIAVYTGRMVPKNSPGRSIYNKIMSSAPNGRCPLCSVGNVTTLDHVLPKSHYPALAVVPINLVPACRDCNNAKKTQVPSLPNDIFLHPYYDNVEGEKWLVASVLNPLAIVFSVQCPAIWPQVLRDRVKHHFDELGLAETFGSNAADQLIVLKDRLEPLLQVGGVGEVENYLLGEAAAFRSAHLNSWQTAMYESLAADPWYLGGGFRI